MLNAAKSLAMTAIDLLSERDHLKRAGEVFQQDIRMGKKKKK